MSEQLIDLAHLDDEYAQVEPAEHQEFDEVPNGRYQAYVDKVCLTKSRAQNDMLKWELVIIAGSFKRRRLFKQNLLLTTENLRWLKADLLTCGLELGKLSAELPNRLKELLDVVLDVSVRHKGTGEERRTDVYFNKRLDVEIPAEFRAEAAGGSDELTPF